jgi:hypothetical protein
MDPVKRAAYDAAKLSGMNPANAVAYVDHSANETDQEIVARIVDRFEFMYKLSHGVARGFIRSAVVSGAGGVGKTFTIESVMNSYKDADTGFKVEFVKGKLTPINLYMMLYKMRDPNSIVVLDDTDGVWDDEDSLGILKAALDTGDSRLVSWMSLASALVANDVPTSFNYNGSLLFISNLNFDRMIASGGKKAAHLEAIGTRVTFLDLKLHSAREKMLWIEYTVKKNKMFTGDGVTVDQVSEILEWMKEHRDALRSISIRQVKQIVGLILTYGDDWKRAARVFQLKQ